MKDHDFQRWVEQSGERFPIGFVDSRLKKEVRKAVSIFDSEKHIIGRWANPRILLQFVLWLCGLTRKGMRNALDIQLRHNNLSLMNSGNESLGLNILHISDPHFNDHDGFIENLVEVIEQADFDLCVLTGDYRFRSFGATDKALAGLQEIAKVVDTKIVAVLGNHDSIRMVPEIERLGISVLVNEHLVVTCNGKSLLVAGVDDPRHYRTDDIERALQDVDVAGSMQSILLAHSPELYAEAAEAGFDAYLCGHTHAGQVCLMPGKTLYKNFRSPRWTLQGNWTYGNMQGYTSAGVGTSVVNARFNCAPEITVHKLC